MNPSSQNVPKLVVRVGRGVPYPCTHAKGTLCVSFRSSALQNLPTKALCTHFIFDFPIISSKINFYKLGAPLRRLAEGHPGELLMKFPSGWASVPGSLE